MLLELARALRQSPHSHGLILAAADAEEWGKVGAREMAGYVMRLHPVSVISVKKIMPEPLGSLEIHRTGQFGAYTPLWLRQLLVAAGRAQGFTVEQATGSREWIERALEVPAQGQGPLLRAAIPAVDIGTLSIWAGASHRLHTPEDLFRDLDPAAFQMTGATVERAIQVLDKPPALGTERGGQSFVAPPVPGLMAWVHDQGGDDF